MKILRTAALATSFLVFSACASSGSKVEPERSDVAIAPLAGTAWSCQLDSSTVRIAFLDEWYAASIGDEIFWASVEYDATGSRVTAIETSLVSDGPERIERFGDRLELEGDGEIAICDEQIEPFVAPSDAPTDLTWETQRVFVVGEVWDGEYECAQGFTDARLHIEQVTEGSVKATFYFAHEPSNTTGSFRMRGTFNPWANTIVWAAGDWIDQPPGYVTIDLMGDVSPDRRTMRGNIVGPGCTGFEFSR